MTMISIDRPAALPSILTMLLCLGVWLIAIGLDRQDRDETLSRAERDTSNLSRIIAEQSERTISGIDTILRVYANEITRNDTSDAAIQAVASIISKTDGILFQLSYADASGRLQQSNLKTSSPSVNLSDREHFIVHRDKMIDGLFISKPVLGRASGKWSIQLTRAITGRDSQFLGIVVASIDPFYFSRTFNDIDVGAGGLISLVKQDGNLLARINMDAGVLGKNVSGSQIFRAAATQESGFIKSPSIIDGKARLVSYRRLKNYPIYVTAGFAEEEFMAEHNYRQIIYYTGALIACCLLIIISYIIIKNMNTLKGVNEILKRSEKKSELASIAKSDFLANMSHEIRTPMNAVIGLSQLLTTTNLDERQRDYLTKITASGRYLVSIINDILDYSKIEGGHLRLESRDFLLDAVLENVANLTAMASSQKGLDVSFVVSPNVPAILRGDSTRLGQIIINIVNNAVKFTNDGCILLSINHESISDGAIRLTCSIKDTGIGISESQQLQLFRSFSQADTSTTRQYGGTGLGLALSKRLCELMDGDITVTSKLGLGSTFTFRVDLCLSDDRRTVTDIVGSEFSELRALVVHGNSTLDSSLSKTLEYLSFSVVEVSSPLDALEKLGSLKEEGKPFDLVVLDERMSDLDGLEAAQIILGDPAFAPAPHILLVVGFGHIETSLQAARIGVAATIYKPIITMPLVDTLATVFGRSVAFPLSKHTAASAVPHAGLGRARLLLAEDNEINREIALALLGSIGVVADAVENGRQAVEQVYANPDRYDAVLMDIQMPEMDGIEACRQIRSFINAESLPIIAMTAHALDLERDRCLDAGMNDHISKPIDTDTLYRILNKWVRVTRAEFDPISLVVASGNYEDDDGLPTDLPPFHISEALVRMNGDRKLLKSLIVMFRDRYASAPESLRELYEHGQTQELYRLAHTLKGVAGSLEASEALRAARNLETALQKDPKADVRELVETLATSTQAALLAAKSVL